MIRRIERELRPEELAKAKRVFGDMARTFEESERLMRDARRESSLLVPALVLVLACAAITMLIVKRLTTGVGLVSTGVCLLLLAWAVWTLTSTPGMRKATEQIARRARAARERCDARSLRATEVSFTIRRAWSLMEDVSDPNCDLWIVLYELEDASIVLTHMPGVVDLRDNEDFRTRGSHASILVFEDGESLIATPWQGPRVELRQLTGFGMRRFSAWHAATARALETAQRTPGQGSLLQCQRVDLPAWVQERLET